MNQHEDPIRLHWTHAAERWQGLPGNSEPWESLTTEPAGVEYREVERGLWVEPANAADGAVLCYIHGGGFVSGNASTHRKLVGHLATAIGARALLVSYPYAPEQVHPAQLDRVSDAYTWLLGEGVDPARLVLAGDSCGAWLALSLAVRARDRGLPLPAAMLLISAWVDLTQSGASYQANAERDPFFHKDVVDWLAANFLGPASAADPAVDLLQADLTGLPPMLIQVGGDEGLLDDSVSLHAIAVKAGVEAHLEVFPGELHTFQMAAGTTEVADRAVTSFAGWLRKQSEVSMS
jgi:acetyl esterase/lipase